MKYISAKQSSLTGSDDAATANLEERELQPTFPEDFVPQETDEFDFRSTDEFNLFTGPDIHGKAAL